MSSAQVVDLENSLDSMQNKPEIIEKETVVADVTTAVEVTEVVEEKLEEAVEEKVESSESTVDEKDSEPCFDNQVRI